MPNPLPPLTAAELAKQLAAPTPPRLLDVREPHEYVSDLGHVAGSELIPMNTVPSQMARLEGEQREIVVVCRSGARAGRVADFLALQGLKVRVLTGGMLSWNEAKLPISRDPP